MERHIGWKDNQKDGIFKKSAFPPQIFVNFNHFNHALKPKENFIKNILLKLMEKKLHRLPSRTCSPFSIHRNPQI